MVESFRFCNFKRSYPHVLPVRAIHFQPGMKHSVKARHHTFNFGFFLRGAVYYRLGRRVWHLPTPCVGVHWPEALIEYGADPEMDELFVCYDADVMPAVKQLHYASLRRPIWPVRQPDLLFRLVAALQENLRRNNMADIADRVDRLCDQMILESRLDYRRNFSHDPCETLIHKIQAQMDWR